MSFNDKNMQKGRLKQHAKAKGETGNHPIEGGLKVDLKSPFN